MINRVSKFQTIVTQIPTDGSEAVCDLSAALRGCNAGYLVGGDLSRILGISLRVVDYKHQSRMSGGVLRIAGPGSSSSISIPISPASPDYSVSTSAESSELIYATSSEINSIVSGNFRFRMSFDPWLHIDTTQARNYFSPLAPVVIPRTGPSIEADISAYFSGLSVSSEAQETELLNRIYFTASNSIGAVSDIAVAVAGSVYDAMLRRASSNSVPVLLSEPSSPIFDNSPGVIVTRSSYSSPGATTSFSRSGVFTTNSVKIWVDGPGNTLGVIPSARCNLNYYDIRRAVYPALPGVPLGSLLDPVAAYLASPTFASIPRSTAPAATYLAEVPTALSSAVVEVKIIVD